MSHRVASLVSSAQRPLRLRMRPDLVVNQQSYQGQTYWVVKDPLALRYYRFEHEEYALLEMLDGDASAEEIQHRFERRFAPQKLTLAELQHFVGMLFRSSLVISDASGQGSQLRRRSDENARQARKSTWTNILAIRIRGIDPDRLLEWLSGYVGWLFSPAAIVACLLLALAALALVSTQFDVFQAKLPGFRSFFAADKWCWLAITLALTKICHELGHGLACKRLGGECHEMGVMFLVLTPCLYCDVSDSWMLPSKWKRAAIGAAGMYVELMMASVATFVWWFSQPGLLNHLCLDIMFVCSVSTLIFNANPLLRYDGYYILSDVIEIPNLRQKSSSILQRKLGKWMLGLPEPYDPFLPRRNQWVFVLYSVAAAAYRWLVALSIFWFLYHLLQPYGLKVVGQIIAVVALYLLLGLPLLQLVKFFYVPGRIERVNKARMIASLAVMGAATSGVALVPLPHYVSGPLHLQPRNAAAVYVDVPGQIQDVHAVSDQHVSSGQTILTLDNVDQWLAMARLEGQRAQEMAQLESLIQRDLQGDPSAGLEMDQVRESIAALQEQIDEKLQDVERLIVKSPVAGTIFPAPYRPGPSDEDDRLPVWSSTPLEARNVGAYLDDGTLLCFVGSPDQLEAVLAIDQTNIEFVSPGQPMKIQLDYLPSSLYSSKVARIAKMEMKATPTSLSSRTGGGLMTQTDATGKERPVSTTYQVSAPLDDSDGRLRSGLVGHGRIHVGTRTIGQHIWRYLCRTFRFDM